MPKHDNDVNCKEIDGELFCKPGAYLKVNDKGIFLTPKHVMSILLIPGINLLWTCIVSLCSGFATGDWTTALGYIGFTIAIGIYVFLCFIPVYGWIVLANWEANMNALFTSFGTTMNSWLGFLVQYYFVWGIIFQIIIWGIIIGAIIIFVILPRT